MGLCKSYSKVKKKEKKIKKRDWEKNGQVSEISKTMGTQNAYLKKREKEMNKIAHVFLQKVFQVSIKREMFQGA